MKTLTIEKISATWIQCHNCNGTGNMPCQACRGRRDPELICPQCRGTGKQVCISCKGKGGYERI